MAHPKSITLTIKLEDKPYVSNSEIAKAAKEGREGIARMLASSGGFVMVDGVKVSYNVTV